MTLGISFKGECKEYHNYGVTGGQADMERGQADMDSNLCERLSSFLLHPVHVIWSELAHLSFLLKIV